MGDAQRDVDAFVDQVDRPIEQIELGGDPVMRVEEVIEDRAQDLRSAHHGGRQGQQSARRGALAGDGNFGVFEIGKHAPAHRRVARTRLAQAQRAGGAMKQGHADMALQKGDGAADCGGRAAETPAGGGEAAFVERRHENPHRLDAIHHSSSNRNTDMHISDIPTKMAMNYMPG